MKGAAKLFFDKIVCFLPKVTKHFKCKQKTVSSHTFRKLISQYTFEKKIGFIALFCFSC